MCSRPVPGAQLPSTEICGNISGNISILFPKFSGFSHVHPFSIIHLEYLQLTTFANPFIGRVSCCNQATPCRKDLRGGRKKIRPSKFESLGNHGVFFGHWDIDGS